jgi:hypothetical protein
VNIVSQQSLMNDALALWGQSADDLVQRQLAAALVSFLNRALTKAWRVFPWPDTVRLEQRFYRDAFVDGNIYSIGSEVYDPDTDAYYVAIVNNAASEPTGADWALVGEDFEKKFTTYDMGEVLGVFDANPLTKLKAKEWDYQKQGDYVYVFPGAGTSVWVRYQTLPPKLTSTLYDPAAGASEGQYVFHGENSYLVLAGIPSGPLAWDAALIYMQLQQIPAVLARHVAHAAYADLLRGDGADGSVWGPEVAAANDLLLDELETLVGAENQGRARLDVRVA